MSVTIDDSAGSGQAITNDVFSVQLATPRGVADITGLDKSAHERMFLLADASATLAMGFNDAANQCHAVFKTVPTTSVSRTSVFVHSGQTLTEEMLYTDYSVNRSADGNITTSAPGTLANGTAPTWS